MRPSYLDAYESGKLDALASDTLGMLRSCQICPRKCKVNRLKGDKGFCKTALKPKIFSYLAHHGEEPPISGTRGSGTIFFSHCNMACSYCQNYKFSQAGEGREVAFEELAAFMLQLQKEGCHNINLVTPTHVIPQILKALIIAIKEGLKIPLVYNTGGYELPETIKMLEDIIDIYLADMRYAENSMAIKYSHAPDYPKYNKESIKEMHRQTGIAKFNKEDIITSGLIIRHLVLPESVSGTEKIMRFIAGKVSKNTYISLMSQYHPYHKAAGCKPINRRISREEYENARAIMEKYGLHNGWTQESGGLEQLAGIHIKPR